MRFLTGDKTKWRLERESLRPAKVILPCVALGLSPFVMQSTKSVLAVCFNTSLLKYSGEIAVGTMTVLTSIIQFAMLPLQGLTQGAQPIISYNSCLPGRVREVFRMLLRVCIVYSASLWELVQLFPGVFVRMFNSNPELVAYTVPALRVYMAVSCILGIQIACQQTFIARRNAKDSLFLAILRKVILLIRSFISCPVFFKTKPSPCF